MRNLLDHLSSVQNTLPAKQRKLCEFIEENGKSVYLMSIGNLSAASGVGRATIMRFIGNLGYETYADFKKALNAAYFAAFENHYSSNPFFWSDNDGAAAPSNADSINACCGESLQLLQKTARETDRAQFSKIVDIMIASRRVNVLGLRTSSPIARYAYYMLSYFLENVRDLSENESMIYDLILSANPGEVVLLFATVPVTTTSIRVAQLCQEREIPLIVITDRNNAPPLPYATYHIVIPHTSSTRLTVLPFLMIIESLINEIGTRLAPLSVQAMNKVNTYLIDEKIIQD